MADPFFVDQALARRVEAADARIGKETALAHGRLHPASGSAVEAVAGGWAQFLGKGSPLNQAAGLGMLGPVAAAEMDRLEAFFRDRGEPVHVEACPLADGSLAEHLARRGYRPLEWSNTLLLPLSRWEGDRSAPSAEGVDVRRAGAEEAGSWAETVARGFLEGADPPAGFLDLVAASFHIPDGACFLARVDGRPAGGGIVTILDGVAHPTGTSTLPEFRGRGVQTALLRALIDHAKGEGCDIAASTTHPGTVSQRNIERMGFRVAYTRLKFLKD